MADGGRDWTWDDAERLVDRFLLEVAEEEGLTPWVARALADQLRSIDRGIERCRAAAEVIEKVLRHEEALSQARIARSLERLAEALAPAPLDVVGTPYVAQRLNVTVVWVAKLAERGTSPKSCVVPGTGRGKPWKFYRQAIDRWIAGR